MVDRPGRGVTERFERGVGFGSHVTGFDHKVTLRRHLAVVCAYYVEQGRSHARGVFVHQFRQVWRPYGRRSRQVDLWIKSGVPTPDGSGRRRRCPAPLGASARIGPGAGTGCYGVEAVGEGDELIGGEGPPPPPPPRRSLDQQPPSGHTAQQCPIRHPDPTRLRRTDRVAGLIREYRIAASPARMAIIGTHSPCAGK